MAHLYSIPDSRFPQAFFPGYTVYTLPFVQLALYPLPLFSNNLMSLALTGIVPKKPISSLTDILLMPTRHTIRRYLETPLHFRFTAQALFNKFTRGKPKRIMITNTMRIYWQSIDNILYNPVLFTNTKKIGNQDRKS